MIALLPMKIHSARVPNKNIKLLYGNPLFFYVADSLKKSAKFDLLAIDTDSDEIAQLAKKRYGDWVQIIDRVPELRGDDACFFTILAYDIELLGAKNDYFQTHSTNPLLSATTIRDAVEQYYNGVKAGEIDSLFAVNAKKKRLYDKNLNPINHDPSVLLPTQDLDVIYEENSNFYIFSGEQFIRDRHRIGPKAGPYVMGKNPAEGVDIDEVSDWDFAEMVLKSGYVHD